MNATTTTEYVYDPDCWWDQDASWTDDDILRGVKSMALARIPKDAAEWIDDNCLCLCERGEGAQYISPERLKGRSVLIFSEGAVDSEDAVEIFLHEAAHAYLRHHHPLDGRLADEEIRNSHEVNDAQEIEAWQQVAEWLGEDDEWAEGLYGRYSVTAKLEGTLSE